MPLHNQNNLEARPGQARQQGSQFSTPNATLKKPHALSKYIDDTADEDGSPREKVRHSILERYIIGLEEMRAQGNCDEPMNVQAPTGNDLKVYDCIAY
ncbi:hypothetical protein HYFRA_00000996 [Hymenoscyphus fraxineus]|uniref:Uncharacterized protein n=1 Tax=Hymenoscyphus fraxineus TaxID=746836 RepID=A0A9N9KQJ1_9HELO|nr:hypothetical protein HYFRA_00000996 [Hymenoscyphus fraxineus]